MVSSKCAAVSAGCFLKATSLDKRGRLIKSAGCMKWRGLRRNGELVKWRTWSGWPSRSRLPELRRRSLSSSARGQTNKLSELAPPPQHPTHTHAHTHTQSSNSPTVERWRLRVGVSGMGKYLQPLSSKCMFRQIICHDDQSEVLFGVFRTLTLDWRSSILWNKPGTKHFLLLGQECTFGRNLQCIH